MNGSETQPTLIDFIISNHPNLISDLETNDEKLSAILYQIKIIGEATKRLSQSFRQQHQEIPWRQMAGMRDVIVHEYDQLDFDVIWDVVENKLPELMNLIDSLL